MLLVNIQGDEPLIDPKIIITLVNSFTETTQIATLVRHEKNWENLFDPNVVKAIISPDNQAIYFSRTAIPYLRDIDKRQWTEHHVFYTHIGIYAYRSSVLRSIVKLQPTPLEQAEKLEQLRWIENGYNIKVSVVDYLGIGVDTFNDLQKVISMIKNTLNG